VFQSIHWPHGRIEYEASAGEKTMTLEEKIEIAISQHPKSDNLQDIIYILKLKEAGSNIMRILDEFLGQEKNLSYLLRTGYSCNFHCQHCFAEDKKTLADFSLSKIKSFIDDLGKEPIVTLSGGEPTVRPDLLEILKYIKSKERAYLIDIQTNAAKFSDLAFLKNLEPYFDSAFVPFHSSNMDIFDEVTQVAGSGELVVQALKNLSASSIRVMTNIVINKFNYKTITETMDLIQKINPGCSMALTHLHPVGGGASTRVAPRYEEIHDSVQKALKKYGYLIYTHYIPRCQLYPYQSIVSLADDWENGSKSKPGINHQDGDWGKVDYAAYGGTIYIDEKANPNWPSLNIEQSKVKSIRCKECRFNNNCIGVWKEYGVLYPDLVGLTPIKER
jgi:MoaA/NifB/PqqE/SkfB family radical SAM enzyme